MTDEYREAGSKPYPESSMPPGFTPCPLCGITGAHFCTGKPVGAREWVNPEPLKVSDVFPCPKCGGSIITTTGRLHECKPQPKAPEPPVSTGWICPVCHKGNAPFVRQCPCEGRLGVSWTDNTTVTTTNPRIGGRACRNRFEPFDEDPEWHDHDCGPNYGDKPHSHPRDEQ